MPRLNKASEQQRSRMRPSKLRKQEMAEKVLALRRTGLSYRAIGNEFGRSHEWARNLCEYAYADFVANLRRSAGLTLGEELDRMDGLIRAASGVLVSSRSTPAEKMRALGEIRRCSEAKVRWLGVGAAEKITVEHLDRAELAAAEAAGLSDDALDRELEALGYKKERPLEDRQQLPA